MWSVDQVTQESGDGAIGNGSYYIPTAIGTALAESPPQVTVEGPSYQAQPGDLVDWWAATGKQPSPDASRIPIAASTSAYV